MFCEYGVEPRAIGSNWQTFLYLIEKFGFDRGRLIAQFPREWFEEVLREAALVRPADKLRMIEKLNEARRTKVIKSSRAYNRAAGDWLFNALQQHAISPFHAIIATQNPNASQDVLLVQDLDELHPLMAVPQDFEVNRDALSLAGAMALMLRSAGVALFVDAYYDPFNGRYQNTLRECLKILHAANPRAICEIHHLDSPRCPPIEAIEREARAKFNAVIPLGMTVSIYRWRQKNGGADFHARYLLTDRGGLRVDAGFSTDAAGQKTDMSFMDFNLAQQRRKEFNRDAQVYELIEPILQIAANGYVERI